MMMPKFFILDTCVVENPPLLRNTELSVLCQYADKLGYKVCIPQIVLDELENHFTKTLNKAKKQIEDANKTISILGEQGTDDVNVVKLIAKYKAQIKTRINELGIVVLDYPKTSHKDIANRAIKRLKPFNENGKGYQDAIIWESVKDCGKQLSALDEAVVFISANTNDFADISKQTIHPDLLTDWSSCNTEQKIIVFNSSIQSCLETHIIPLSKQLTKMEGIIKKSGQYHGIDLLNVGIAITPQEYFSGIDANNGAESLLLPPFLEMPFVESTSEMQIEDVKVRRLWNDDVYIQMIFAKDIQVSFYADRSDPFVWENPDKIINWEHNEHYVEAETNVQVKVRWSFVFNSNDECKESSMSVLSILIEGWNNLD